MQKSTLEKALKKIFPSISILQTSYAPGGDINNAIKLITNERTFFVKYNNKNAYPHMLQLEFKNLDYMRNHCSLLHIPKPISFVEDENTQYLILEFIERGYPKENFWELFGKGLAELHSVTNEKYGFFYDNYMGSLYQKNEWKAKWIDFFIENRLKPQIQLAISKGLLKSLLHHKLEKIILKLNDLLIEEKPALVHGDLWGGNYFAAKDGNPVIYDPACYFGHREIDIAMTTLFGGFDSKFYSYYNYYFPMEKGWKDRLEIYNLYPLLVHLNLFGESYAHSIERIINKYV